MTVCAAATITLSMESVVLPPTLNEVSLDIPIRVLTEDQSTLELAGYQLTVEITGPDASLRFIEALPPASTPYAFAGSSAAPLWRVVDDGRRIEVGDFLTTGLAAVPDGSELVTLRILISDTSSRPASTYDLVIHDSTPGSFLATSVTSFVPFAQIPGRVTTGVPEPAAIPLVVLGLSLSRCARPPRRPFGAGSYF